MLDLIVIESSNRPQPSAEGVDAATVISDDERVRAVIIRQHLFPNSLASASNGWLAHSLLIVALIVIVSEDYIVVEGDCKFTDTDP